MAVSPAETSVPDLRGMLLWIWAAGTALCGLRVLLGCLAIVRLRRGAQPYSGTEARGIAATRQLAKRQYTWLRAWRDVRWLGANHEVALRQLTLAVRGAVRK